MVSARLSDYDRKPVIVTNYVDTKFNSDFWHTDMSQVTIQSQRKRGKKHSHSLKCGQI